MEANVSPEHRRRVLRRISDTIREALLRALDRLQRGQLPVGFEERLHPLLETAYQWNSVVKRDIVKYDYEPFIIEPGSVWDAEQMESFERVRKQVTKPIVCTVTLGLIGGSAVWNRRGHGSHVQLKANVLVQEWFWKTALRPQQAPKVANLPPPNTFKEQMKPLPRMTIGVEPPAQPQILPRNKGAPLLDLNLGLKSSMLLCMYAMWSKRGQK